MKRSLFVIFIIISSTVFNSCKKEELPELITYEISGMTSSSAVSGGVITSDGGSGITVRGICWSQQTGPELSGNHTNDGTGIGSFISNLTGLEPATKYFVRAYATNSTGTQYGEEISFTTPGGVPVIGELSVSDLTSTGVVLKGTINPCEFPTEIYFEFGTTSDYGSAITGSTRPSGSDVTPVSVSISNLHPGTVYHFRIKASNQLGVSYSQDHTFTTLGQKPAYTDFSVKGATLSSISLGINVNPNDLSSSVTVEYGTSDAYGSSIIAAESPLAGNTSALLNINLTNLLPGTTYFFRVKLENSLGLTCTEGRSFKTYNALDADKNGYYSVQTGTQVWLSENLRATHYQNGDAILNVPGAYEWSALKGPGYCTYKNEQPGVYGNIYNFYAASDSRNVCPAGWHVPSMTEWNTLISFLGGIVEADTKIREAGLSHWLFDTGATNSTGLTLLPAGDREGDGTFINKLYSTFIWSSTWHSETGGMLISLDWNAPKIFINPYGSNFGASIRCIKN